MTNKISRKNNVDLVIDKLSKRYDDLLNLYQQSLETKKVEDLEYEMKIYLGDAGSMLDYCAHDIAAFYGIPCSGKTAFPIVYEPEKMNPQEFIKLVRKRLPKLKEKSPQIFNYLESIQPYKKGFEWMADVAKLNNEHKHDRLVPQKRSEVPSICIEDIIEMTGDGALISLEGPGFPITINGKGIYGNQDLSPHSQNIRSNQPLNVRKTTWVDFRFENSAISALQLIKKIKGNVPDIGRTVYNFLG